MEAPDAFCNSKSQHYLLIMMTVLKNVDSFLFFLMITFCNQNTINISRDSPHCSPFPVHPLKKEKKMHGAISNILLNARDIGYALCGEVLLFSG